MSDALSTRSARRDLVARFARERPAALWYDDSTGTVVDVFSGKALRLDWARVAELAERRNSETGAPYLVVVLDDATQIVLADAGVAFAPVTASTGPLPDLPPVVCLRDLAAAEGRLTHFLLDHPDEEPTRAHVATFLFCLATVDGARAVGLDVAPEERRLERLLRELEARRGGAER